MREGILAPGSVCVMSVEEAQGVVPDCSGGIRIFPPEFALGIPAESRSAQNVPARLRVSCGDDAGASVLCRYLLIHDAFQLRQRVGDCRRTASFPCLGAGCSCSAPLRRSRFRVGAGELFAAGRGLRACSGAFAVVIFRNHAQHGRQRVAAGVSDGAAHALRIGFGQRHDRQRALPLPGFGMSELGQQPDVPRPQLRGSGDGKLRQPDSVTQQGFPTGFHDGVEGCVTTAGKRVGGILVCGRKLLLYREQGLCQSGYFRGVQFQHTTSRKTDSALSRRTRRCLPLFAA